MIFDARYTSGVGVWDASHLGYDSSQFAASPDLGSAGQQVQPDLVVLELGINDLIHGIPPAELDADLAAIGSTVAANDGNRFSVAIMEMWNPTFQAPDLYSRYVAMPPSKPPTVPTPTSSGSRWWRIGSCGASIPATATASRRCRDQPPTRWS